MSESVGYFPNLQRGILLREQGRYKQAIEYLKNAIAANPEAAQPYYQIAFCECDLGEAKNALKTLERAIKLDPNVAEHFALQAWVQTNLSRYGAALKSCEKALSMNPFSIFAHNTKARIHLTKYNFKKAEEAAREVLKTHPRNCYALNILASSLRMQGRYGESQEVVKLLLSSYPNVTEAHASAGWTALEIGDYQMAYDHFLIALQKNPNSESAKRGLKQAINSRVPIYRFMRKMLVVLSRNKYARVILIAALMVYTFFLSPLVPDPVNEVVWVTWIIGAYFIIFTRGFANFFLLFHPIGRHALTRKEKIVAYLTVCVVSVILLATCFSYFISQESYPDEWIFEVVSLSVLLSFLLAVRYVPIKDWVIKKWMPRQP